MNKTEYITINSPEPLKNEVKTIRNIYWTFGIITIIGFVLSIDMLLVAGLLAWMATFLIVSCIIDVKTKSLREKRFLITQTADSEQLFMKMQSLFISKYNWEIEKDKNGNLVIITNKYIYDVAIKEENGNKYFTIWWRMSIGKAFTSTFAFNLKYPIYRNVIASMGIIAYEIQQAFPVMEEI